MPDYEASVERQIREAMDRGEFDDLPGAGRKLDLGGDEGASWWAKRKLDEERQRERLIEAARELDNQRDGLWALTDKEKVRAEVARLNHEIEELNSTLPHEEQVQKLDPGEALRAWRLMYRMRAP